MAKSGTSKKSSGKEKMIEVSEPTVSPIPLDDQEELDNEQEELEVNQGTRMSRSNSPRASGSKPSQDATREETRSSPPPPASSPTIGQRRLDLGPPPPMSTVGATNPPPASKTKSERIVIHGVSEVSSFNIADYPPIANVAGPQLVTDGEREKIVEHIFPAALSIYRVTLPNSARSAFIDRLATALEVAQEYFATQDLPPKKVRDQRQRIEKVYELSDPLTDLDHLTRYVYKTNSRPAAFRPKPEYYTSLIRTLIKLKKKYEDQVIEAGIGRLDLPLWAQSGDIYSYWSENDFEVVGVAFRRDAEIFMAKVATVLSETSAFDEDEIPARKQTRIKEPEGQISAERKRNRALNNAREALLTNPEDVSSGRRFNELIQNDSISSANRIPKDRNSRRERKSNPEKDKRKYWNNSYDDQLPEDDSDPDSSDSSSDEGRKGSRRPDRNPKRNRKSSRRDEDDSSDEPSPKDVIDSKFRLDSIPKWNGNPESLLQYLTQIEGISHWSPVFSKQLGKYVPLKFTDAARDWWYSIRLKERLACQKDWSTLKALIARHYLHEPFMEKQHIKANTARFRDAGHQRETPNEYFNRKINMLELCYSYNDRELIKEIMRGTPQTWHQTLQPDLWKTTVDLQQQFRTHEDTLMDQYYTERRRFEPTQQSNPKNPFNNYRSNARVNAVGWSKATTNPQFPKDDTNVSKRATPEEKGARPCRHCGSVKHWDRECKYAKKGERQARVNHIQVDQDDEIAQTEYDNLYYDNLSEEEEVDVAPDFQ